ncbi:ion transporter [Lacibacter sp. H407]|uniref:ion transporter n=1 Tax=Lacibacter sp. H407 TaxID=3133423 RepID=UPI0030BB2FFE
MYHSTRKKVHILLHPELGETKWDKIINAFIIFLIISNVLVVILETVPWIHDRYLTFFYYFDLISVIIFTIEYVLRVWSCDHDPRYSHTFFGRLKYMFSYEGLIDLLAILPFYVHVVVGLDLRVLRMLRLLRFLRLFRLTAYMKSAKMIRNVFVKRASDLKLSVVLILILIIIASSVMYFAEHNAQPAVFSSIPATLWYAIVTLTTVGYGDMIPVTIIGKIMTGVIMLSGVAIFALPAGIITAGFLEEVQHMRGKKTVHCPHCGANFHPDHHEHGH